MGNYFQKKKQRTGKPKRFSDPNNAMSSCLSLISISLGVLCGVVIYRFLSRNADNDDVSVVQTSDYSVIVSVADRLEELYGGKAYVGLRIPDPDTGLRQNIDIVLVTNGEAVVISVKNFSGFISINEDNSWSCTMEDQQGAVLHPDPVAEVKKQASILESYLEQRGIAPQGSLTYKVILPNPKLRYITTNLPEVITYNQLMQLKPAHYKLSYIIGTAPAWDRLELQGSRFVWGEFLEFKGEQEDALLLGYVKRSKVSRLIIQNLTPSTLIVMYSIRDFRNENAAAPEWKMVRVKSDVEVLFRTENSTKVHKFRLSSILSLSLSA